MVRRQPDLARLRYFKLYELPVILRVADQEVWDTSSGEGIYLLDGPVFIFQPPQVLLYSLIKVLLQEAFLLRLGAR